MLGVWSQERDAALARLRQTTRQRVEAAPDGPRTWATPDGSPLVAVLLSEGEVDLAWADYRVFGCDLRLERRLADARANTHPNQALPLYRQHLDRALEPAKNVAYDAVVELLEVMQPLYRRQGNVEAFTSLVADIRTTYRRRRNLLARLDRAGL